jgi:aminopeptidase N
MRLPLTALALSLAAVGAHAEAPFSFDATPGKLPKDVIPLQYTAHLVPDVANNTFSGSETVEIEVKKATSTIMLNALNMEIDAATLSGKGLADTRLEPMLDKQAQTLSFKLDKPLAPGKYTLALKFRGVVNREPRGLFYLKYKNGADDKSLLATTMEPTDARRLLPTWDSGCACELQGLLEHAGRKAGNPGQRLTAGVFRRHAQDAKLPVRAGRWRDGAQCLHPGRR